ncbi:MAG: potassium transporter TrkA [Epsilonproteobacteria bacterium]|nr:potassium transporter TrkA [Campylobacterota bacterium]
MSEKAVLVFGYNDYGIEIAKNVIQKHRKVTIFSLDEDINTDEMNANFNIERFDLSDDWDDLENNHDIYDSIIFCALMDEAKNIFLTLSLCSIFKDISIIALAKNNEDANKLKMAGANKVIPIVQTTANIITDMLKKPIMTNVLHNILYEESDLRIEQIKVKNTSYFGGKYPADIEWSREHGIIVLSVIHEDMSGEFIYSSKAKHNTIKKGDIFVAVGYSKDLKSFKRLVGGI